MRTAAAAMPKRAAEGADPAKTRVIEDDRVALDDLTERDSPFGSASARSRKLRLTLRRRSSATC